MDIALRDMGLDTSMIAAIHDMLDLIDEGDMPGYQHPSKAYFRDTKAMKATPADIIEYPNAYHFVVDMPGLKPDQIKVHLEDGNVLVVAGERRREKDEKAKFVRMERRVGKLLKKFVLPENADTEKIHANYQDGVLTVTVEKTPPPEPKKPKLIEVKVVGQREGAEEQGGQEIRTTEGAGREGVLQQVSEEGEKAITTTTTRTSTGTTTTDK